MSELDFSIKFENNTKLALEELERRTDRALYAIGVKAVEGATDAISGRYSINPAVDTGRLRASISFITANGEHGDNGETPPANAELSDKLSGTAEKNSVVVGSNVAYAEYVHNGTSRMAGRPFLREGIDRTKADMERQANKIFKGEL